ncbi:MAG: YicC family protein, partial [Deltaproteobacteria bacterium]|nr:YicC family protein [Deltaproteobacteria bacterium]
MIKSMTAFSRASKTYETITADVTMRSYNSRHLDIAFYCPESCQAFEEDIKKNIAKTHGRGRIEIRLSIQDDAKDLEQFEVDEAKAVSYFQALKKIKDMLNLSTDITMENILSARNVIVPSKKEQNSGNLWKVIELAIGTASTQLDLMRREEGKNLLSDLTARIDYIEDSLKQIETDAAKIPLIYKQRLMERISHLTA